MSEVLELAESQPAELGGVRFGVANIWERAYVDADGVDRSGLTAQLMFEDGHFEFVGAGSEVRLGGEVWSVDAVHPAPPVARLVMSRGAC